MIKTVLRKKPSKDLGISSSYVTLIRHVLFELDKKGTDVSACINDHVYIEANDTKSQTTTLHILIDNLFSIEEDSGGQLLYQINILDLLHKEYKVDFKSTSINGETAYERMNKFRDHLRNSQFALHSYANGEPCLNDKLTDLIRRIDGEVSHKRTFSESQGVLEPGPTEYPHAEPSISMFSEIQNEHPTKKRKQEHSPSPDQSISP